MTLYRSELVAAFVTALQAANTLAGQSVFSARDWPLTEPQLPAILIKAPSERKESMTRGRPEFTTTATIAVLVRTDGPTSQAVEARLEKICEQIENAVLAPDAIFYLEMVQQFTSVETEIVTTSEGGRPIGDAKMLFSAEFYEQYTAPNTTTLAEIGVEITPYGSTDPALLSGVNITNPGAPLTMEP